MKILPTTIYGVTLPIVLILCCCSYPTIADTTTDDANTDETGTKNKLGEIEAVASTPQPPLVDAQPKPSYEPKTSATETATDTDTATVTTTDTNDQQQIEPANATTPQPPLSDAQNKSADEVNSNEKSPDNDSNQSVSDETSQSSQAEEESKLSATSWLDTHPKRVNADWLQLTSGEWLRGRIVSMQKDSLDFDSDELNKLEIKWSKVKYIKSSVPYSLRFDNSITAIGSIEITQDKVFVSTDYDEQEFDRDRLLIIASGRDTELSRWTTKMTLSLNIRKGNTEQTDFTTRINAKRRTLLSRLALDYLGNYTKVKDTETINNQRLNTTYDIFITRNFFWTLVTAEFFRDPFQNIKKRLSAGTAFGYALINTIETEWEVSAGPGYQETEYVSVTQGSKKDSAYVLVLSTKFDTELNTRVDLEGTYTATIGDNRIGNYSHHSLLTIETEITDRLDFDVTLVWDRTQRPVPDENNISPDQDDLRFLIGLGYEL